jgi:hypothetical protein
LLTKIKAIIGAKKDFTIKKSGLSRFTGSMLTVSMVTVSMVTVKLFKHFTQLINFKQIVLLIFVTFEYSKLIIEIIVR